MVRDVTATCLKPPAAGSDAGPQVAGECGEPQAAVPLLSVSLCLGPTEQQLFKLEANHHYQRVSVQADQGEHCGNAVRGENEPPPMCTSV